MTRSLPGGDCAAASVVSGWGSREEAAQILHCAPNFLTAATQRGEVPCWHVGARCFYPLAQLRLRSVGVSTPEEIGELCKGLGVRDMRGLLEWLAGDGDGHE